MGARLLRIAVVILLFFMTVGVTETSRVDLQIESIQIQPSRPYTNVPIVAVATIRNTGSQAAVDFFISVSIVRNGKKVRTIEDVPVLSSLPHYGAGLSVPIKLGILEKGSYEIEMEVDSGDRIKETNEKNNKRARSFEVWTPPYVSETY